MEIIDDSQSIKMFGNDCRIRGLSKHTIESYISTLNLFSKFLKKREYLLMTVDRNILREYISYLRERESLDHVNLRMYRGRNLIRKKRNYLGDAKNPHFACM